MLWRRASKDDFVVLADYDVPFGRRKRVDLRALHSERPDARVVELPVEDGPAGLAAHAASHLVDRLNTLIGDDPDLFKCEHAGA